MTAWIAAATLAAVAAAHSWAGEALVIGPLLRDRRWRIGLPRPAAETLIRVAWHLTTLAWLGLAAALVGVDGAVAFGAVCVVSAAAGLTWMRWHFAWVPFLAAGLYALGAVGVLPRAVPAALAWSAVAVAVVAAGLHVDWAAGSRVGSAHVFPENPDTGASLARRPHALATLTVAGALLCFAALVAIVSLDRGPTLAWWALALGSLILAARVVGEGRWAGLFKRVRSTEFARRDDAIYTPLVALLACGAVSALHLGGAPF